MKLYASITTTALSLLQVEVVLQQDKFEQPRATFVFKSGARSETPLANLQPRQLEELLQLHRDSSGPNHFLKHGGPKVWTERRSLQVRTRGAVVQVFCFSCATSF